jgi:hypothetical protein
LNGHSFDVAHFMEYMERTLYVLNKIIKWPVCHEELCEVKNMHSPAAAEKRMAQ